MIVQYWIPGIPKQTRYDYRGRKRTDEVIAWQDTIRKEILCQGKPSFDEWPVDEPLYCKIRIFRKRAAKQKHLYPVQTPDAKNYFACTEDAISCFLIPDDRFNVSISCLKFYAHTFYPATNVHGVILQQEPGVYIEVGTLEVIEKKPTDILHEMFDLKE